MKNKVWIERAVAQNFKDSEVLFNSKRGAEFLMTWSLLESRCFGGYMTKDKIKNYTANCVNCDNNLETAFTHFHKRYQDGDKLHKLLNTEQNWWLENVLSKSTEDVSSVEKTRFMLYVIDRYKNYMFEENHEPARWRSFDKEVDFCLNAMQDIYDYQQKPLSETAINTPVSNMPSISLVSYIALEEESLRRK